MDDLESELSEIRGTVARLVKISSQLKPIRDQYAYESTRATTRASTRPPDYETVEQYGGYAVELAETLPKLQAVLDGFQAQLEALKNNSAHLLQTPLIHTKDASAEVDPAIDKAASVVALELTERTETADSSSETATEDSTADDTSQAVTDATTPDEALREVDKNRAPFVLNRAKMGCKLVPTLAGFMSDSTFRNRVTVEGPGLDITNHGIELGEADHFNVEYAAVVGGKTCNVWASKEESSFQWPDLNDLPHRPSKDEARAFLEDTVRAPPDGPISYYGGGGRSPLDDWLHPGDTLAGCTELRVANSTFYHVGAARSSTAFHCEDADFLSCNITDVGYKIWLVIRLDHTAKFEQYIRANWTCGDCAQFVRHLSLLIAPSTLQQEGIEFDIHCAGPGEMIITRPRQYHAVVNFSACIARSINFLLAGPPLVPHGLAVCDQDGLYHLRKTYPVEVVPPPGTGLLPNSPRVGLKRKAPLSRSATKPRLKSPRIGEPKESPSVADIKERLLALDPSIQFPLSCPSDPAVLHLAAPILGQFSESQLKSLWSAQQQEFTKDSVVIRNKANSYDTLKSQVTFLRDVVGKSHFYRVKVRIIQYLIARHIDDSKRKDDRRRARIPQLDEAADSLWPQEEQARGRKTLRYHLEQGRKWAKLCGPLIGLLPLIPLSSDNTFNTTQEAYHALQGTAVDDFRRMFEGKRGKTLCSEGAKFADQVMAPTSRQP